MSLVMNVSILLLKNRKHDRCPVALISVHHPKLSLSLRGQRILDQLSVSLKMGMCCSTSAFLDI